MKKVSFIALAMLFAVSAVFVSCTETENDPPSITVNLNGTDQSEVTVTQGTEVSYRIDYSAPGKLAKIEFEAVNGSTLTGFPITTKFDTDTKHQITGTLPTTTAGEFSYTTRVTDKDDQTSNKTIKVTVKAATNNFTVKTFTGKKLFSSLVDGSNESAAASATGTLYKLASIAVADQSKVDFIYFNNKMYSPVSIPGTVSTGKPVSAWTVKNATTFADITSTLSAAAFDALTDEVLLSAVAAGANPPTATSVDIAKDKVIFFKTAAGTGGIFRVTDFVTGYTATSYATITIKTVLPK